MALLTGLLIFFALDGLFLWVTAWLPDHPARILAEKAVYACMVALAVPSFRAAARWFPASSPPVLSSPALRGPVPGIAQGIATGLALYGLLALLVRLFPGGVDPVVSWQFALGSMIAAVLEELFYRRLLLNYFLQRSPPVTAIALSSVCFAVAHPFPAALLLGCCGIAFGVLYWRSGLVSAILAHGVYNVAILLSAGS